MQKIKKNWTLRVMFLALAFTLISTCLLGSTLAKYTTSLTGTDTARVAKWGFSGTNITDIFATSYNGTVVKDPTALDSYKRVAPGIDGSFGFTVASGKSEVTTALTFSLSETNNDNIPIVYEYNGKYYSSILSGTANLKKHGESGFTAVTIEAGGIAALATVLDTAYANIPPNTDYSSLSGQTLSWFWAFEQDATGTTGTDISGRDTLDTTMGKAATALVTLNATLTAVQVD